MNARLLVRRSLQRLLVGASMVEDPCGGSLQVMEVQEIVTPRHQDDVFAAESGLVRDDWFDPAYNIFQLVHDVVVCAHSNIQALEYTSGFIWSVEVSPTHEHQSLG